MSYEIWNVLDFFLAINALFTNFASLPLRIFFTCDVRYNKKKKIRGEETPHKPRLSFKLDISKIKESK